MKFLEKKKNFTFKTLNFSSSINNDARRYLDKEQMYIESSVIAAMTNIITKERYIFQRKQNLRIHGYQLQKINHEQTAHLNSTQLSVIETSSGQQLERHSFESLSPPVTMSLIARFIE